MLWRFKVEVGSFYIATNGSAFNKESFMVIGRLYEFCQDNEISAIEISNSKWHQEERKRLGLFNSIPTCFEDMYEYFPEDIEYVMENYYPCLSEINLCADHRTYKNMVQEGRYTGAEKKLNKIWKILFILIHEAKLLLMLAICHLILKNNLL